jgi:hypothetical protein
MSLQLSLRLANEPISEMLMVTAILGGLPKEFSTIVSILEAEDATLTVNSIQAKLCAMEQSIRDNRTTSPDATAMLAGRNLHCEYCKKPGHSMDRCFTKIQDDKIKASTTAAPASVLIFSYCGGRTMDM